jgi:cytochrome c-type biogenesis protein CcmH/NrfG
MSTNKENENTNLVQKQTLYIAILVSITLGFMIGAVYTSFKLADQGTMVQHQASMSAPSQAGQTAQVGNSQDMSAETGARILKLEEFLKKNPDNADAWTELGNLFYDASRFGDSIEAYQKSLALAPGNPSVLTDMGVMYRRNKQPEKAIEAFEKAIEVDPAFEIARFNKGVVLMHDMNDLSGGIGAWEALVKVNPMATAPNGEAVSSLVEKMKQQQ